MNCDEHFSWVACRPRTPGAYASHTDDERFKDSLAIFKTRERKAGAMVKKVTCNEAHALLAAWLNYTDGKKARRSSTTTETT